MANEAIKITQVRRRGRPSYVAQLLDLEVGKPTYFRLTGTAYMGFHNAAWQLKKKRDIHYKVNKVDDSVVRIIRLN
jgi:hypothetical protein